MDRLFFTAFLLVFSIHAHGSTDSQETRFEKSIEILHDFFSQYNGSSQSLNKLVQNIQRGPRRVAAFNLQALGQIYKKYEIENSKTLFNESIRFEAKILEDAIGGVDKWRSNLKQAQKKNIKNKVQLASWELEKALEILLFTITKRTSDYVNSPAQWTEDTHKFMTYYEEDHSLSAYNGLNWITGNPTIAEQMLQDIENFPWMSYNEDRNFVLSRLVKHLQNLETQSFNFNLLEDTPTEKGLHEFRREVRWFSFKATNLNGTLRFFDQMEKKRRCPSEELAILTNKQKHPELAKSRYNKLPKSPFSFEKPCGISRCLFYKINKVVSDIGTIKDGVEVDNFTMGFGNKTPKQAAQAAQRIAEDLKSTDTLSHLVRQISACYQ